MAETREEKIKRLKQKLALVTISLINAKNKLNEGHVVNAAVIEELSDSKHLLEEQIKKLEDTPLDPSGSGAAPASDSEVNSALRGQHSALPPDSSDPEEGEEEDPAKRAMLRKLSVRTRAYNMSAAALRQRQAAAKSPEKAKAMIGNANAYKTGAFARNRIRQFFRPCKSTCPQFPCELIADGETEPGSVCLDKKNLVQSIQAVMKAMNNGDMTDLRELVAVQIGHGMEVLQNLADDINTYGVKHLSEKIDKEGNVIGQELKLNPSLLPYAKLLEVLNTTPQHYNLTDQAREKTKSDKEIVETLADRMSRIAMGFTQAGKKTVSDHADDDKT
jgi:hypothetical protein